MNQTIHQGDCQKVMQGMPDASVDAVVTDPPYGLGFMDKAWDHGVPGEAFWREALRVAKPGAHLVAFRSEERRVGKECRSRWSPYH